MEVPLSSKKQARLEQLAKGTGKDVSELVEEAIDRLLDYDERFIAAIERGRESVWQGRLLEHEEVVERIERILRS